MIEPPFCTFDHGAAYAVIRVELPEGCAGRPGDRVQDLCAQHAHSMTPRGDYEIAERYDPAWPNGWKSLAERRSEAK